MNGELFEFEDELERFLIIRKTLEGYDFKKLYYVPNFHDKHNSNDAQIKSNVTAKVNSFFNDIFFLEYIISASDILLNTIDGYVEEYPSLISGLEFLVNVKQKLMKTGNYDILSFKIGDNNCYFSGVIANRNIEKTKRIWLDVIDDILYDLEAPQ